MGRALHIERRYRALFLVILKLPLSEYTIKDNVEVTATGCVYQTP